MHCCYAPEALCAVGMLRVSRAALLSTPQLVTPIFSFLAVEVDKKGTSRQEIGCGTGLEGTCLCGHAWVDCSAGFGPQGSSGLQGGLTAGPACPQLAAASKQTACRHCPLLICGAANIAPRMPLQRARCVRRRERVAVHA